jgi:hypothetical protein
MRRIKLIALSIIFLSGCSTPQTNQQGDTTPLVSLLFAGPVLEELRLGIKFSLATTDPSANVAMVGFENAQVLISESKQFELTQFKTPQGKVVSAYQWTGHTEFVEVSDNSPSWLYDGKDTVVRVKACVAKKNSEGNYHPIGCTVQTATYTKFAKNQIIEAYQYNKLLLKR